MLTRSAVVNTWASPSLRAAWLPNGNATKAEPRVRLRLSSSCLNLAASGEEDHKAPTRFLHIRPWQSHPGP